MTRILIIEDDVQLVRLLCSDFELEGYHVHTAKDGLDGLDAANKIKPDLIVLDVMLPKMNGYDVCRALRKDKNDVPILMLTAKGQEAEKVVGLELGADDYMSKPFGGMELLARIKALLRRHKRILEKLDGVSFEDIRIDFRAQEASKAGKQLPLTYKEFQILELLLRYRGEVVTRERFLQEIWGYDALPTTRTVDNQVMTLRQKLGGKSRDAEYYIATVHGVGYKFVR